MTYIHLYFLNRILTFHKIIYKFETLKSCVTINFILKRLFVFSKNEKERRNETHF